MSDQTKKLYTCEHKGGTYELLGHSIGAGTDRGHDTEVYRNAATGQLHTRLPDDFQNRMLPIASDGLAVNNLPPSLDDALAGLGLCIALLEWNRQQAEPPIRVGYEYGVANAVLKIQSGENPQ